jgi:uncharacterized protein
MTLAEERAELTQSPLAIGFQEWRSILFVHWPIDPAYLRPHVPGRLAIDTYDGRAWVSLTPFSVRGARLRGLPAIPGVRHFHEVNVRTYVRSAKGEAAVWFLSLDAASPLAAALARATVRLPYWFAHIERGGFGDDLTFHSERASPGQQPATLDCSWRPSGEPRLAETGSLEHFLVERYALFSRAVGGALWRGRVRHSPWLLQDVEDLRVEQTLTTPLDLPPFDGEPIAQCSSGVQVTFLPFHLV